MARPKKDLYEGMEPATGKEKCAKCGHSAFKSHVITCSENRFEPVKAKCKYCNCKGSLSLE